MELALRVDNGRPAYPAVPDPPSPSTIGKTGPGPTCWNQRTTRNGGPEPVKQATIPAPSTGPPGADSASLGVHESTKGHFYPFDSDRPPPGRPGSQSDAAAARRHGSRRREAKVSGLRGYPRGQLQHTDDLARTLPFPELPDSTPKAYRHGLETTTLRRLLRSTP